MQKIDIELTADLRATVAASLMPADIMAIKADPAASARYAAMTAINTLAVCEQKHPAWTAEQKQAVAMETAACVITAIHAVQ